MQVVVVVKLTAQLLVLVELVVVVTALLHLRMVQVEPQTVVVAVEVAVQLLVELLEQVVLG